MDEQPLEIYKCLLCERVFDHVPYPAHVNETGFCNGRFEPVRVFREEDVRRLWIEARTRIDEAGSEYDPDRDFPAPEEWRPRLSIRQPPQPVWDLTAQYDQAMDDHPLEDSVTFPDGRTVKVTGLFYVEWKKVRDGDPVARDEFIAALQREYDDAMASRQRTGTSP